VDSAGRTPLHRAVRLGKTEVVDELLKRRAAHSAIDEEGKAPIHYVRQGEGKILRLLHRYGAHINLKDNEGNTLALMSARLGNEKLLESLLQFRAETNIADSHGATPLRAAISRGRSAIVSLLLEHGAQIETAATKGGGPLATAATYGYAEIVILLIKFRASPTEPDASGITPDYYAKVKGHTAVLNVLQTESGRKEL